VKSKIRLTTGSIWELRCICSLVDGYGVSEKPAAALARIVT
jgi:hypothetical protein